MAAAVDFKPCSESYLKRLRMPIKRGQFDQPKQFEQNIPAKEISNYPNNTVQSGVLKPPAATPHREDYGVFDRTNGGYLGCAARHERQMEPQIPSMDAHVDEKPQHNTPETFQKIRPMTSVQARAPPSDKDNFTTRAKARAKTAVAGPTSWKDRGELENVQRGKIIYSGWRDPETGVSEMYKKPENYVVEKRKAVWSDSSVKNSIYKSSAQRAMEDVNWDSKFPVAVEPPETTVEKHTDPVNERLRQIKQDRKDAASEWQMLAKGWDYHQMRQQYSHQKRPYSYSSNYKTHQIPNYQGHCGGLGEIDDTYSQFVPLSVKRNDVPPYYGTGRTGNIPGYTGKIWWLGVLSAHDYKPENTDTTTFNTHVKLPPPKTAAGDYARKEHLTKLVTTVPPHNPFRRNDREVNLEYSDSGKTSRANTAVSEGTVS